jgi:hypothetical protein
MSAIAVGASGRVAGELVGKIRRESGLSQAELARIAAAAGMEVSVGLPQAGGLDVARAGEILAQVLDLAEQLPQRPRGELAYPPLARLAA